MTTYTKGSGGGLTSYYCWPIKFYNKVVGRRRRALAPVPLLIGPGECLQLNRSGSIPLAPSHSHRSGFIAPRLAIDTQALSYTHLRLLNILLMSWLPFSRHLEDGLDSLQRRSPIRTFSAANGSLPIFPLALSGGVWLVLPANLRNHFQPLLTNS